jgi:hypothetical protein
MGQMATPGKKNGGVCFWSNGATHFREATIRLLLKINNVVGV